MPDLFLYAGEPTPSDIRLRDPTTSGGPPPERILDSTAALPLGGSATLAVALAVGSTSSLPLGGTVTIALAITVASTAPLPLGGAITMTAPVLGGGSVPRRDWLRPGCAPQAVRHVRSVARLPLGGFIELAVMEDVEAVSEDVLAALLMEDDVYV